jgi:hypothetical protein
VPLPTPLFSDLVRRRRTISLSNGVRHDWFLPVYDRLLTAHKDGGVCVWGPDGRLSVILDGAGTVVQAEYVMKKRMLYYLVEGTGLWCARVRRGVAGVDEPTLVVPGRFDKFRLDYPTVLLRYGDCTSKLGVFDVERQGGCLEDLFYDVLRS